VFSLFEELIPRWNWNSHFSKIVLTTRFAFVLLQVDVDDE